MNEEPSQKLEQPTADQRPEWEAPQVRRMRAGEAENRNVVTFDGGAGLS